MPNNEDQAFRLNEWQSRYQVQDNNNNTWLDSADKNTAKHYQDLLNRAFNAGFKQGFNQGRISS